MIAVLHTACATGEHAWGVRLMQEDWPRFLRSPLSRVANVALIARAARARLLLNHEFATTGALSQRQRAEVEQVARSQLKQRAGALADSLRARLAYAADNRALALALLRRAAEHSESSADAERIRYALGMMLGGDEGAALCRDSERALRERGVVNPPRYVTTTFPELFAK